jgi:large subunit ribosomal protein L35|tara:strand:+ start:397 stop:615 length:219 start_codon:yes stop_codon:yes gene_type:complete
MPKLKTNKAAKKRFKISARGKVMHRPAGKQHLNSGMSATRRRKARKWRAFDGKHDAADILRLTDNEGKDASQ